MLMAIMGMSAIPCVCLSLIRVCSNDAVRGQPYQNKAQRLLALMSILQKIREGNSTTLPKFASPDPTHSRLSQPPVVFTNYHSIHRNESSLSSVCPAVRKASTYKYPHSINFFPPPKANFQMFVGAPAHT